MLQNDIYDLINERIKLRGKNQFELKIDYNINPNLKINRYKVEAYFFIPKSLGINSKTYNTENFFEDIDSKIRFKTPRMAINTLFDQENLESPYWRVLRLMRMVENKEVSNRQIIRELKMLVCIIKSCLGEEALKIVEILSHKEVDKHLWVLLYDIDQIKAKFVAIREKAETTKLAEKVKTSFIFADEYLSLLIENNLINIFNASEKQENGQEIRKKLAGYIRDEIKHRIKENYESVPEKSIDNESIAYRGGKLKRYFSSVLFLSLKEIKRGRYLANILFALAAGLAMFIAIIITIYSSLNYVITSLPFVTIGVLGYMLKDRMKDWLKNFFVRKLSHYFPRKSFHIYDSYLDKNIGTFKNQASYVKIKELSGRIKEIRDLDPLAKLENGNSSEEIIKYERWVNLYTEIIERKHERTKNINDIIRFNAFEFIQRCDDPYFPHLSLSKNEDKLETIKCGKTYHLNVIFKFSYKVKKGRSKFFVRKVQAILDKNGIKRLVMPTAA